MGKITVKSIWSDYTGQTSEFKKWERAIYTPIVPRKMVEMIIKECDEDAKMHHSYGNLCAEQSLIFIKEYAESLLKELEGDES